MKIGILTFHRAHNYGALLQAIALRHVLTKMSHDVFYVDYWPDFHSYQYKFINKTLLNQLSPLRKINYLRRRFLKYSSITRRINIFNQFIGKFIGPYCASTTTEYDVVVYGSDQILRRESNFQCGFDPVFYGSEEISAKKRVTYAASMGILTTEPKELEYIAKSCRNFDSIGVREQDLKDLLEGLGIEDVELNLDPTLLLTKEEWADILKINTNKQEEKYILFYDLMTGSFNLNAVKKFAEEKGLKLKVLKASVDNIDYGCETITDAGPDQFVELIANAEFVFTSSFHGLAFSVIFNKQFFASYKKNGGRAETLLKSLNLQDRLLSPSTTKISISKDILYSETGVLLENLRKESQSFLKDSISE